MFNLGESISSALQHPLSLLSNPPPLPDAFGLGPTFDWSTPDNFVLQSGRTSATQIGPLSSTSRPISTTPAHAPPSLTPSRPSSSRLCSQLYSGSRRAHPYRIFTPPQLPSRPSSTQMLDPLFDWSSIPSPTPSFLNARMATPVIHSRATHASRTPRMSINVPVSPVAPSPRHPTPPLFPNYNPAPTTAAPICSPVPQPPFSAPLASSACASPLPVTDPTSRICQSATASTSPDVYGQPSYVLSRAATPIFGTRRHHNVQSARMINNGASVTAQQTASAMLINDKCGHTPLFLPDSPPPTKELARARRKKRGSTKTHSVTSPVPTVPVIPSVNESPRHEQSAPASVRSSSEFEWSDLDTELAQTYGMELGDTGFQNCEQSSDVLTDVSDLSIGKESRTRAPSGKLKARQKKAAARGSKWTGGPGGGLKFNSKPEGYRESPRLLERWSYSEDGTTSQNVNERLEGDVHFSPATQYTDDDEPFMSWVCTLTLTGVLRWVHFSGGQPHPHYGGYVFKPAQLPRTPPRWLKEASYKSTQLTTRSTS